MPEYDIERWDAVIPKDTTFPFPMIYIKPDANFVQYAKDNNYMVLVTVKNTASKYDDNAFVGIIDSSGYFPNNRPNFFNKTGYFVITLFSTWNGYPPQNGNILIQGAEGPDKLVPSATPPVFEVPRPIEWYGKSTPQSGQSLSSKQLKNIFFVVGGILIILILIFILRK